MAKKEQGKLGKSGAEQRLRQARKARSIYEADWYLNLAFFQGEQWVGYQGGGLYRPHVDIEKVTDNRIRPIVRSEVAALTKNRPAWAATPRDISDRAVTDAAAGKRLVEWAWDEFGLAGKRREAITWARVCGAGFIKTCWDSSINPGREVLTGPDGKAIRVAGKVVAPGEAPEVESMEGVTSKRLGGGEVVHAVRAPFDIYPDPLATSIDDCRWLIDEVVRSPEYIKERYGKDVSPDAAPQAGVIEGRFLGAGVDAVAGEKLGVRVFELWEVPSASCPNGRKVVWCDAAELEETGNEYGELPYSMQEGIPVPGRFWPDAVVTDMRPLQKSRNMLLSQARANADKFGNPALLRDRLSQIEYYGAVGEQILHSATTPTQLPQYLQPPSLPSYIFNLMGEFDTAMKEGSGRYEVAQGSVPSGVTAASAISLLQEQNANFVAPDIEAGELALARTGQQTLNLQCKYYTDERIIAIVGEDGIADVATFKAEQGFLVPNITVVAHSTFPRSLAAKQASIRDTLNMMLQYGVPIDAPSMSRILKDMEVGGLERLVQSYTTDVVQAQREHAEFLRTGTMPAVREVDNDPVHIGIHRDFAKTQRFVSLPPEQQEEFMNHIRLHEAQDEGGTGGGVPLPGINPAPAQGGAPVAPPPGTVPTAPSGAPVPQLAPE